MNRRKEPIYLDVRTDEEFQAGHIPGAVHVDIMSEEDFREKIAHFDKSAWYIVYCRTEKRSAYAVQCMHKAGFECVEVLHGGYLAWKEAGSY